MLIRNPFFLLSVSPIDSKELISEAFERKLSDSEFEESILTEALKNLMTSKSRLESEIGWFIDTAPQKTNQISDLLRKDSSGSNIKAYKEALKQLNGVSRCNLAAYICERKTGNYEFLRALIKAQSEINIEEVQDSINENRRIAGFPSIGDDLIRDYLNKQKKLWIEAAIQQVSEFSHPGSYMTKLLKELLGRDLSSKRFLEELVERYEALIISTLRNHEDAIKNLIAEAQGNRDADLAPLIEKITEELKLWGEYARPSQLIFGAKGLDEPRSEKIFDTIREFCLWLAKEANQYRLSLNLSKVSKEIFLTTRQY